VTEEGVEIVHSGNNLAHDIITILMRYQRGVARESLSGQTEVKLWTCGEQRLTKEIEVPSKR
jgi:hypothetical protein